jgi:homoserine O-acetyltransferase
MPGSTDLFCSADDNEYEARLIPNAVFSPIPSVWGHFAGRGINSADNQFINDNLQHLLALSTNG